LNIRTNEFIPPISHFLHLSFLCLGEYLFYFFFYYFTLFNSQETNIKSPKGLFMLNNVFCAWANLYIHKTPILGNFIQQKINYFINFILPLFRFTKIMFLKEVPLHTSTNLCDFYTNSTGTARIAPLI